MPKARLGKVFSGRLAVWIHVFILAIEALEFEEPSTEECDVRIINI